MVKDKLRTLGRRVATWRAVVFLCAGVIVSAMSGMFCGFSQRGKFSYETYMIAEWSGESSRFAWAGPTPSSWSGLLKHSPERIQYTNSVHVGLAHLCIRKSSQLQNTVELVYDVHAWGFPLPSMRNDIAERHDPDNLVYSVCNDVEKPLLRGVAVSQPYFHPYTFAAIPIYPWWPGFVLNTLLWSLFIAWITKTFQRARWFKRMQKGQCIKCKYQVGSLRTCPECGTEKPVQ